MDTRSLLIVAALPFAICGCQTKVITHCGSQTSVDHVGTEGVLAAYGRYFPEAQRVPPVTSAPDYFSGVYRDDGPPGDGGLRGRILYLFPDGGFTLTEWADIMEETVLMSGDWRYEREMVRLTGSKSEAVVGDQTFVPFRFADAKRDVLVLMGTPGGYRAWTEWVAQFEPGIRKARVGYDNDTRVRTDFTISTQEEEMVYVTFFHGTYARVSGFPAVGWEEIRGEWLSRIQQSGRGR